MRRKFGAVTLLLACVFVAGWVRSQWAVDQVVIPGHDKMNTYFFHSMEGVFSWSHYKHVKNATWIFPWDHIEWTVEQAPPYSERDLDVLFDWQFRLLGIRLGRLKPDT